MKINGIQLFDQTQRDQPDFMAASCCAAAIQFMFIFYGTEQFLHMGAEPLGWIGAEFVIISIIYTGIAA